MRSFLSALFLCLLLTFIFSSCNNLSSEKKRFEKLIRKSSSTSYQIDISIGKTETEKTLIVKFNNVIECLILYSEKKSRGEQITSEEQTYYMLISDDFLSFMSKNQYNVRNELILKMEEIQNKMDKDKVFEF